MASFLIVGGAGYVGSHCGKALAQAGHTCITFDNLSTGHREFVRWGPLIEGDIRDTAALDRAFKHHVDAVLHFAALAYVADSMADPARYYDVNVHGTRSLLDAMRHAGVNKIIFSSSCAVYGAQGDKTITEQTPTRPINPYGFTKMVCERMMDDYEAAYGIRSVRLRYFNAAGADPEGEIGERHEPEPHLIPLVLDAAAGRRADVKVYGSDYDTPDGTAVRDYVHVADLAEAHVAAAGRLIGGGASAAINLGTGTGVSVRQLIHAAEAVTGRNIRVIDAPRRPGDPACLVANADYAKIALGWAAKRSDLTTVLRDAWAWSEKSAAS